MAITIKDETCQAVEISTGLQNLGDRHRWAASLPDTVMLDSREAALFLTALGFKVSGATLNTWRCRRSDGPTHLKIGRRAAYRVEHLRRFIGVLTPTVA